MLIEIKHKISGKVLFSLDIEYNTLLQTIEKAILSNANLTYANLYRANLTGADLTGANLTGANLTGTNLTYANLTGANLTGTDLTGANLTGANLYRADLTDANLTGANLYRANLTGTNLTDANLTGANIPIYCRWYITIIDNNIIKIGCKEKVVEEWVEWFENSEEIFETNRNTETFKRIRACFYAHKIYLENL